MSDLLTLLFKKERKGDSLQKTSKSRFPSFAHKKQAIRSKNKRAKSKLCKVFTIRFYLNIRASRLKFIQCYTLLLFCNIAWVYLKTTSLFKLIVKHFLHLSLVNTVGHGNQQKTAVDQDSSYRWLSQWLCLFKKTAFLISNFLSFSIKLKLFQLSDVPFQTDLFTIIMDFLWFPFCYFLHFVDHTVPKIIKFPR